MERKGKIALSESQLSSTNPYSVIQRIADIFLDYSLTKRDEEKNFLDIVDVLADEGIQFFSDYQYE